MTKNPNNRNLRGWIGLAVVLTVLIGGIASAWGLQYGTVARNTERIEKTETVQTEILQSLARIETKLKIERKEPAP